MYTVHAFIMHVLSAYVNIVFCLLYEYFKFYPFSNFKKL